MARVRTWPAEAIVQSCEWVLAQLGGLGGDDEEDPGIRHTEPSGDLPEGGLVGNLTREHGIDEGRHRRARPAPSREVAMAVTTCGRNIAPYWVLLRSYPVGSVKIVPAAGNVQG